MFAVHSVVGDEEALKPLHPHTIYSGVDIHLLHELKTFVHSSIVFDGQLIPPVSDRQ